MKYKWLIFGVYNKLDYLTINHFFRKVIQTLYLGHNHEQAEPLRNNGENEDQG